MLHRISNKTDQEILATTSEEFLIAYVEGRNNKQTIFIYLIKPCTVEM